MLNFKIKHNINNYLQWGLVIIGYLLLLNRIRYGVSLSDEGWYIAEPLMVSKGYLVPFVTNITQSPGFTVPLSILYSIYGLFSKSTDGIVLFSRISYCIWTLIVFITTYFVIKHNSSLPIEPIYLLLVLFSAPQGLFAIDYNTIGINYLPLILSLLLVGFDENKISSKKRMFAILAGILMGRTIIGTPHTLFVFLLIIVFLIVNSRRETLFLFLAGVCISAVLVVGYICLNYGIQSLIDGLIMIFTDISYFRIEKQKSLIIILKILIKFFAPFALCMMGCYYVKHKNIDKKAYIMIISILVMLMSLVFMKKNIIQYSFCWFIPIVCALFSEENKRRYILLSYINVVYLFIYLFTSCTSIYVFDYREYWMIFPSIVSLISLDCYFDNRIVKTLAIVMALTLSADLIYEKYTYAYDEADMSELTIKVSDGIWKGLYTTEAKNRTIKGISKTIKEYTNEKEKVLFLDWASYAYLMNEGEPCSPTSLDPLLYFFNDWEGSQVNNPAPLYDFFYASNNMPDKIIYINHRDVIFFSIENDEWLFNDFVTNCYRMTRKEIGDGYVAMCFELTDKDKAAEIICENRTIESGSECPIFN